MNLKTYEITYRGINEYGPPHQAIVPIENGTPVIAINALILRLRKTKDEIEIIGIIELQEMDIIFVC